MSIRSQSMPYRDGNTFLIGFLVCDDTRGHKRPGVLLVHGGAGLDEHAKGRARRLAEHGFVVLAGDMYGRGGGR